MNNKLAKIGSIIVTITVFLFALFEIIDFTQGSFFVCLFLPIGFIMITTALQNEATPDRKVAANIGLITSAVYCTFIMLVYFAQLTTATNEQLPEQTAQLIRFDKYGLLFNYDMLGYGMMALSTFFTGLALKATNKTDKWLKALMMIHGIFFLSCIFMPMTGIFVHSSTESSGGISGRLALVIWCAYFLPIGILSYKHFSAKKK